MKTADKGVYQLLRALAGGRVYAMRAPRNATAPFIVYQEVNSTRWRSINNPSGIAQANFQIDVYASTLYQAKDIASEAEILLDGYRGSIDISADSPSDYLKIGGISYQNGLDLLDQTEEPLLSRRSDNYLITYYQE